MQVLRRKRPCGAHVCTATSSLQRYACGREKVTSGMPDDILRFLRLATVKLVNEAVSKNRNVVVTDSRDFKIVKHEVRSNEDVIPDYVDCLVSLLKHSNSKRRQALTSLFDYFFNRSHKFRENTVDKLQELLLLVCETNPLRYPLPGPTDEAQDLKAYAIKTIKKWHEKFGPGYEKLNYVADFLRQSKAVDFDSASAELLAERMRKAEQEQRAAAKMQQVVLNVRRKFDEAKTDIDRCIASAETALSILIPVFGFDSEMTSENNCSYLQNSSNVETDFVQQAAHGYSGIDTISVVLPSLTPEISISDENEALVEALQDTKVMLDAYRKNIVSWQNKINGAAQIELLMRDLTSVKGKIDQQCQKINELKVKPKRRSCKGAQSSDSEESDLELVPEKQVEDFVLHDEIPQHIMKRVKQLENEEMVNEPCCSKSLKVESSETKKDEDQSKSNTPVVPFGLDLKYWGERRTEAPIPRNIADCHRFWRPPEDDDRPGLLEKEPTVSEVRMITWIGEPLRADKRCKARLPSGKLCPRMDLHKCPLHGIIIDRDDEGFPLKEVDVTEHTAAQMAREQKEEEDYLMDLEAGTGRSFINRSTKKSQRKQTVRQRLEKKLLDPRTIKRVSAVLDAACKARIQRKFGQQFAHSLSK